MGGPPLSVAPGASWFAALCAVRQLVAERRRRLALQARSCCAAPPPAASPEQPAGAETSRPASPEAAAADAERPPLQLPKVRLDTLPGVPGQ